MPSLRAFSGQRRRRLSERRPWAVKKTVTIKENRAFRRIYSRGKSAVRPLAVLILLRNPCSLER